MNPLVAEPMPVSATNRLSAVLFVTDGALRDPGVERETGRPESTGAIDLDLARARWAGLSLGLVAAPREPLSPRQSTAVMRALDDLFGPFDVVATCFHTIVGEGPCDCVGLAPGTVRAAAAALRLPPSQCLVVGATTADIAAAAEAGAPAVVMPVVAAIDLALESLIAPDRALEHSLHALEMAWKAS
jgi:D-glycero-D-manno-heptose 1,7-bisphosphate phosphatase